MTTVSRMNVDVTATTGKFDAAMAGVQRQLGVVGRAAKLGSSIGGGGFGIGGGLGMLGMAGMGAASGPLLALTASIGMLTAVMQKEQQRVIRSMDAMDLAMVQGLDPLQASQLSTAGRRIKPGGTAGDAFALTQAAKAALPGIEQIDPGGAANLRRALELGSVDGVFRELQFMSRGADRFRIGDMLGGSRDDFMRLMLADLSGGLGTAGTDAGRALDERAFLTSDAQDDIIPSWFRRLMQFLQLDEVIREPQDRVVRAISDAARQNGPGL